MSTPSLYLNDDSPRVIRADPTESHIAADRSLPQVGSSHEIVLRVLEDAVTPLTEEQIVARGKAFPYMAKCTEQRLRSAVPELKRRGWVERADVGAFSAAGNPAASWQLKDAS